MLALLFVLCCALAGASSPNGADAAASRKHVRIPISANSVAAGAVDVTSQLGADGEAAGTGIVIDPSGQVLTNNHVIEGATQTEVTVPGVGTYPAQVIGSDSSEDVALLQVAGAPRLVAATIGDSSQAEVGDPVKAVGNANGSGGAPEVTSGHITDLSASITTVDDTGTGTEHLDGMLQTSARIVPGESGGPLVDRAGEVIGMDTAADVPEGRHSTPASYAIPINRAMSVIKGFFGGGAPGGSGIRLWPMPAPAAG